MGGKREHAWDVRWVERKRADGTEQGTEAARKAFLWTHEMLLCGHTVRGQRLLRAMKLVSPSVGRSLPPPPSLLLRAVSTFRSAHGSVSVMGGLAPPPPDPAPNPGPGMLSSCWPNEAERWWTLEGWPAEPKAKEDVGGDTGSSPPEDKRK